MSDIIYTDGGSVGAQYRLQISGANLELLRDNVLLDSQPLASVNAVTINGGSGNDSFLIDQLISLPGGITFNGGAQSGAPGDAITVQSGTSATLTYTSASNGTIVLSDGTTTASYTYTGLEPLLLNSGSATDYVFNLPGGTNTQLEDDGTAGNNTSQLRDTLGGFETTTFLHPTGSLTVNGTATDNVTVNLVDDLGVIGLTINANTTTFTSLGATTTLASVTTDATGTTALDNGGITTTGAQSYNDAVVIGANVVLGSTGAANLSFGSTVNGAFSLIANTAGTTTFGGAVGGTTALTSVTTDVGGSTALNGGSVATTGAQSYADAVIIGANTTLTSTGSAGLSFGLTVNGAFSLAANTAGTTTFGGAVGDTTALTSVTTDAAGSTALNGGSVTTTGNQTYNDAVMLGANTALTSTFGGDVSLASTVNGAFSLTVSTAGATNLLGAVGGTTALTSVTTDAPGVTFVAAGVTTTGAQTYNDQIALFGNLALTSTGSGNLTFAQIDNNFDLTLNTAGTTTFGGAVGSIAPLASLTTDAAGSTALNGGSVTTTGAQTYNDAVTLGAATALTGTAIAFDSTLNNNGFGLTVTNSGAGLFSGAISGGGGFTHAGSGTTTFAAANSYGGATTINAGTLLINGSIASSTTTVNNTGTLGGTNGTVGAVNIASGGALAPGASAGILTATGAVTFSSGAFFNVELGGTNAGTDYDQLVAGGAVALANATLNASLLGSPVAGTDYRIIDKTSAGLVSGTFTGLPDGANVTIGGRAFQIDYNGGDGNDVTLSLGTLKVSGSGPVDVLADESATTLNTTNSTSPIESVDQTQQFNEDITATVNSGVTVNGFGLAFTTTKPDGTITVSNHGSIVADAVGSGAGLLLTGAGVNLVTTDGTISGTTGIQTVGGTTQVVVTGTVTGTGGTAIAFDPASFSNVVDLKPTAVINGNLVGSGNDDTVRLSGTSGSGSFDLNKLGSGFSQLVKAEGSTWNVSGTFADPDAATIIVNGALLVNGTIGGNVIVGTGFSEPLPVPPALLGGSGAVGNVLAQSGGVIDPGTIGASAGTLTITGNLTMSGGSILNIEIGGAGAGQFDVLDVSGTAPDTGVVELGAATLTGSLFGGFTPALGQSFKIIDNAGSDAVASPFNGISEGAGVAFGGQTFLVSYVGGDGNDVTLTAVANGAPGLTGFGPTANVTQAGPAATPQILDGDVTFTDVEGNFNTGTLIVAGLLPEDTVSVLPLGSDPGQFFIVENGAVDDLYFEGNPIGTITGGAGSPLTVTFNGSADTQAVDALIENLTLLDTAGNPTFGRDLVLTVTDGAGASTGPKAIHVNVFNGEIASGTSGNDSFAPLGNAHIDAGGGIDTITLDFALVDATVAYSGNQVIIDAPSRHLVLSGFEVFNFTDGTVHNDDGSPLIDDLFYYSRYHDVWTAHVDADAHYNSTGWHENRDPDFFFSTSTYLSANPDVKAGGVNPLTHFDTAGWLERRVPSINFDPAQYLAANPDVAAAHVDPLRHFLQFGAGEGRLPFAPTELIAANGFDYVWYLQHNPDVAASGVDPFQHFETVGWKEGRNPNALFDTNGYLANYADVAAAHVNPLDHYNQFGWHEGRDPSVNFDTTSYLAAYSDVNAAHIDPLVHFLHFGIHEGRSAFADGVWG